MLLTSFDTYEQNYNKKMVLDYNLGNELKEFNKDEVILFNEKLSFYVQNIKDYNMTYKFGDWQKTILSKMEELIK